MNARARLAFVSLYDAADHNAFSGAAYAMRRELAKFFDILDWFPLRPIEALAMAPTKLFHKIKGAHYELMREPAFLRGAARILERRAQAERPDLIFSPSSVAPSRFDGDVPVFWAADLSFSDYLEGYVSGPARRFVANGHLQEAQSVLRARRISFPTDWAARGAMAHHGAAPAKIDVIPWGANLPQSIPRAEVVRAIETRATDCCEIVFIGRDWHRKGGDLVIAAVDALNRRGVETHLTVIGCVPPLEPSARMVVHPDLDKGRSDHWASFRDLMLRAHFFFMPSRAEAYGHVFCEAAAFGVVPIGRQVGGIPTIIKDGVTGFLGARDAAAETYAEWIAETFNNRPAYQGMALAARDDYEERLNWETFGQRLSASLYAAIA